MEKHWKYPLISGLSAFALPTLQWGLQMLGITISPTIALIVVIISGLLLLTAIIMSLIWYLVPFIKRIRISLLPLHNKTTDIKANESQQNKKEISKEASDNQEWIATIKDGALIGSGFEFFPNRDVLSNYHTLTDRAKSLPTIWALWHTGSSAWGKDIIKNGNVRHLILPNPRGEAPLDKLAKLVDKKEVHFIQEIVKITEEVLDRRKEQDQTQSVPFQDRIEVRWYSGITTNSIMIGNPEPISDNSWVQIDLLIPPPLDERPTYAMTYGQTPFKDLFDNIVKSYKRLWDTSKPLSDEDVKWIREFGK